MIKIGNLKNYRKIMNKIVQIIKIRNKKNYGKIIFKLKNQKKMMKTKFRKLIKNRLIIIYSKLINRKYRRLIQI